MTGDFDSFRNALQAATLRALPGAQRIESLKRLSAGATLETWSFDAIGTDQDGSGRSKHLAADSATCTGWRAGRAHAVIDR